VVEYELIGGEGPLNTLQVEEFLSKSIGKEVKILGYKPKGGEYKKLTDRDKYEQ
jgi:hypothetical protein